MYNSALASEYRQDTGKRINTRLNTSSSNQSKRHSSMTQETGFNSLLTEAKRKGYLIHEDLMRLLDNDLTDSDEMERIISRLADFGTKGIPSNTGW